MLDLGIVDVEENDYGLNTSFLMSCGCIVRIHQYGEEPWLGLIRGTPECPMVPHESVSGVEGERRRTKAAWLRLAGWAREVLG